MISPPPNFFRPETLVQTCYRKISPKILPHYPDSSSIHSSTLKVTDSNKDNDSSNDWTSHTNILLRQIKSHLHISPLHSSIFNSLESFWSEIENNHGKGSPRGVPPTLGSNQNRVCPPFPSLLATDLENQFVLVSISREQISYDHEDEVYGRATSPKLTLFRFRINLQLHFASKLRFTTLTSLTPSWPFLFYWQNIPFLSKFQTTFFQSRTNIFM